MRMYVVFFLILLMSMNLMTISINDADICDEYKDHSNLSSIFQQI